MAVVSGTVTGCQLVRSAGMGLGNRKTYFVTADFAVYTASSDSGALTTLNTTIQSATKNGKTVTLRQACGGQPGVNASGAVYALNVTVNGTSLEFDLGSTTAEANTAACSGVGFYVTVDES